MTEGVPRQELTLHPMQALVMRDPHRYKVVVAGRRWGKSKLSAMMLQNKARLPRRKVWYIAPSYRMAKQIMWEELKEMVPRRWVRKTHETDLSIKLINGSVIECKGADDPDSLRGVGLHYVVLDEYQDMKEEVWTKVIRPTLARDRGHALFLGTPKGYNSLHSAYMLGQDVKRREWASWQFETITSPFIPKEEIQQAMEDMDPKSFRQEFKASFESMSGRVYHTFNRQTHVGNYPFDPKLPIWVGQDFNVDPMSTAIMQYHPDTGEVWIVDEIYLHNSNTQEVCDELERRYWRHTNQITIYPDPAGGNRNSTRGESDLDIFRQRGFKKLKYRRKHPAISDRVNSVNRMWMSASGAVRMKVDAKCKNIVTSFDQTMYKEGSREVDKRPGVEHPTDAVGYCIELEFPTREVVAMGLSL